MVDAEEFYLGEVDDFAPGVGAIAKADAMQTQRFEGSERFAFLKGHHAAEYRTR